MKNLLEKHKIIETPFRKQVMDVFNKHNSAIPLSIIEKELKKYNRITLYRTMKMFLKKGIVHEITINGEESNYAICNDGCNIDSHHHQHIHFKCTSCGIITCVETIEFPKINLPNYKINQLEIQAIGLCDKCNV